MTEGHEARSAAGIAWPLGHEVQVIDPLRCYVDIASHDPAIPYRGEALEGLEAVIEREARPGKTRTRCKG